MEFDLDLIARLKEFGLNSYEAKLWLSLLFKGVSNASDLADVSGVPRSRAYDVLETLERKGFIIVRLGKPIKYLAVPPGEVIDRVKNKVLQEAEVRTNFLEQFKESEVLEELNKLHSSSNLKYDVNANSASMSGFEKFLEHLGFLLKNHAGEVLVFGENEFYNQVKHKFKENHDVKFNEGNNLRCVVFGENVVFFTLESGQLHIGDDQSIWVKSKPLSDFFKR